MNNLEIDDESGETPLVSPFPHSDNDSDNKEVLNELCEYENVGMLRREKAINSFDGGDLAFQCMIGFSKSIAYFDPFLPMNIITRKAYNTIMINEVEVIVGRPFRNTTKLEYDYAKGLISFNRIFNNYTFQMPRTIPRFKHWGHVSWSKIPPILVLSPEYQVDESMKEWLIRGHVIFDEKKLESS
ncbi:hypothetical protein Tco_0729180 [Tanacetum coccineum]|uniref:Uncharacterized protein n=1 Tax=Tanacetum coccineum TaxID=301880 RepID=A0ABQ4YN55_9ASTR